VEAGRPKRVRFFFILMDICIATATNRKATNWKNETITWDALVVRLKKCKRTEETVAEYKAMTKDRQAEVKDVGGFVGGPGL